MGGERERGRERAGGCREGGEGERKREAVASFLVMEAGRRKSLNTRVSPLALILFL